MSLASFDESMKAGGIDERLRSFNSLRLDALDGSGESDLISIWF
jgi:hypothetical protein